VNIRHIPTLAAAIVLATGCGDDRVSGGGDEMGNFVRVSILDSTGAPAAGARVQLRSLDQILSPADPIPPPVGAYLADTNGRVEIPSPGSGRWMLVSRLGPTGRADTLSTEIDKPLPLRTLRLGRLATLRGHLEPVAGQRNWITLAGRAVSCAPDSMGDFRLDSVEPGPVVVVASDTSKILDRKMAFIAPGEERDLGSFASDWSGWSWRKDIWLNTGTRGVAISEKVVDLPIPLRLTNSDIDFAALRSDFSDLRATRPDGRPLPLSIEQWDSAGGVLTAWILVDTVFAGRDSQAIVLRGGNATAKAARANPFDASHGWSGVWHMGQDLSDMTGSGHGAVDNSSTYKSGGQVGECRWFTRSTPGAMSAPGIGMDAEPRGDLTIESWVRLDNKSSTGSDPIVSRQGSGYRLQRDGTSRFLGFGVLDSTGNGDTATVKVVGKTDFTDGQFHHVAGMKRGDTLLVFVDGARDGQKLYTGTTGRSSAGLGIGQDGSLTWDGMIDELRIGRVSRSDDWIKLSFEAQKKTSMFITR